MEVYINNTNYTAISRLSFEPQADVTSLTLPINEFVVDIKTSDVIDSGQYAQLRDDNHNVWAKYWITDAHKVSDEVVRVTARATTEILDRFKLPATMFNNVPMFNAMLGLFYGISQYVDYTLDSSLDTVTISGFCPEQTARERLQWMCFVAGAYVKTFFNDRIEILPIGGSFTPIPESKTFYQPTMSNNDIITSIKIRAYSYRLDTPGTTESWVTDGTNYWVETYTEASKANAQAGSAPENVLAIEQITLVNSTNYQDILDRLANYVFLRYTLEADVLNNGVYQPGKNYNISTGYAVLSGAITELWFRFGKASRSKAILRYADSLDLCALTISYTYGTGANKKTISSQTNLYERGSYVLVNPEYQDIYDDGLLTRTIYAPQITTPVSVQATGAAREYEIPCNIAMQITYGGIATINRVDDIGSGGDIAYE